MYLRILTSIFSIAVIVIVISHPSGASAQKVLQCAPGQATVNNNLRVNGDLTVNNNAAVNNNAIVTNDLSVINGNLYLGPNGAKPYITDNAGSGILFYSQGGDNFLWQSGSGNPGAAAMVLGAVSGLPVGDNGFNLQVHGKVSSYQLHTLGIHLDMQSGIGSTPKQNILRITNTDNTGSGFGAAVFHGANNWQANTDDNLIFSGLTNAQDIGTIGLAINTVSGNVGIKTVNPQITLAIGDNDTGLKWIGDGNFQLVSNGTQELTIDPGNVRIRNNLCFGVDCKSAWPAAAVEDDPQVLTVNNGEWCTGDAAGKVNCTTAAPVLTESDPTVKGFAKTDIALVGSPGNCSAGNKLTFVGGIVTCAPDIDTDTNTDAQTLSLVSNDLSISGGNTITLPAGASGDITSVTAGTNLTGGGASGDVTLNVTNSPTFSGDLIVWGNTILGDHGNDTTTVNGNIKITGGSPGAGKVLTSDSVGSANWNGPTTGSCSITFHKSYSCALTVNGINDYTVSCSSGENHGECRGTWSGLAFNQQCSSWGGSGGWKVGYFGNTYVMQAEGKQNNNKSPGWCARSCRPGINVDISGQEDCGTETITWP